MNKKKQYIGKVVSNKMSKTLVVLVPVFKNVLFGQKKKKKFKKFFVHNNLNNDIKISINSFVLFEQSRPISKKKKWILMKKIMI